MRSVLLALECLLTMISFPPDLHDDEANSALAGMLPGESNQLIRYHEDRKSPPYVINYFCEFLTGKNCHECFFRSNLLKDYVIGIIIKYNCPCFIINSGTQCNEIVNCPYVALNSDKTELLLLRAD